MKKRRIGEKHWKWFGYAQHFICADRCLFHMATLIGDVLVSSVGAYRSVSGGDDEPVGSGPHLFETLVFKADGSASCGCCPKISNFCELAGERSMTAEQCQEKHMGYCLRAAKGAWQS